MKIWIILLTSNQIKSYGLHVSEKKKQIAFLDLDNDSTKTENKFLYEYKILKGANEFFNALKDIQ